MGYPDSAQAGSNLFQMAGNMDSAQGSAEQWQVNNGGFGPGPVRPPVMDLFINFYSMLLNLINPFVCFLN